MSEPTNIYQWFDTLAKVLLRCTLMGIALLVVWFAVYMFAADSAYALHRQWFGLSEHELQLIFYCGMGLTKLFVIVFFLFPWLAIRLVLRNTGA